MSTLSRDPAASDFTSISDKASAALRLMVEALDLIDANGGPHDVGAFLDQAICRLQDRITERER